MPGTVSRTIEAFQLDVKTTTYVFDLTAEQWRAYASFDTGRMSHDEIVEHAAEIHNEWLAESLSERIAVADDTPIDR